MSRKIQKSRTCTFHLESRHKCNRDPTTGECQASRRYNMEVKLQGTPTPEVDTTIESVVCHTLYNGLDKSRPFPLGDSGHGLGDSCIICGPDVDIRMSPPHEFGLSAHTAKPPIEAVKTLRVTITVQGQLQAVNTVDTQSLANSDSGAGENWLDAIIGRTFVRQLNGTDPHSSGYISEALLIGGILKLLCSVVFNKSVIHTKMVTHKREDHSNSENLAIGFQMLLLRRLCYHLHEFLGVVRSTDFGKGYSIRTRSIYAACGIYRSEISFFRKSLRNGFLSTRSSLPLDPRKILLGWLESLEKEIDHYLHQGCGIYADWQNAIGGSKKRTRRKNEIITVSLHLQQTVFCPPPRESRHLGLAPWGDGDLCLLSRPASPALAIWDPRLCAIEDPMQLPSHVCHPLPDIIGTWAETSEITRRDAYEDVEFME